MGELNFSIMQSLLKQLWFQYDNCLKPIENMGIQISEAAKISGTSNKEIIKYLNHLIDNKYIQNISTKPLLYEFTKIGEEIKSDFDIEKLIQKQ